MRAILAPILCLLAGAAQVTAQIERTEPTKVEDAFRFSLGQPQRQHASLLGEVVLRLRERAASERAFDLEKANESPVTKLLELTSHVPVPLGNSDNRIDTFFLQNYLRPELNPVEGDPLSLAK